MSNEIQTRDNAMDWINSHIENDVISMVPISIASLYEQWPLVIHSFPNIY